MINEKVITRFAPSPTGALHIGGARTALFNWAFARRHGGAFILRVEDTDRRRSTTEATEGILRDLQWLGLDWDQGPYHQSQRLDIYREHVQRLLDSGRAYESSETPSETQNPQQATRNPIRLRMPNHDLTVHDQVLGAVTVKAEELEDFIIVKSDGFPTYHLAVVVDDALMGVTHVIRGQEHLSNTPRHRALQEALGFNRPTYAHIPLILNPEGSKMSKRDKAGAAREAARAWMAEHDNDAEELGNAAGIFPVPLSKFLEGQSDDLGVASAVGDFLHTPLPEIDVSDFRAGGYLPDVLCNYLARLGWSPGSDLEKFDNQYLIEHFGFEGINRSAARFDRQKLFRFNADAIAEMPLEQFTQRWKAYCEQFAPRFTRKLDEKAWSKLAAAYHERSRTLAEPCEKARFFILDDDEIVYDQKAVKKVLRKNDGQGFAVLHELKPLLEQLDAWNTEQLEATIKGYAQGHELGMGKVAQPLRVAVTGATVSPSIFQTLEILGKHSTLARVRRCLDEEGTDGAA